MSWATGLQDGPRVQLRGFISLNVVSTETFFLERVYELPSPFFRWGDVSKHSPEEVPQKSVLQSKHRKRGQLEVCERVPSVGMIGRGAAAIRLRADVLAAARIGVWADPNGRASGEIRWRLVESI